MIESELRVINGFIAVHHNLEVIHNNLVPDTEGHQHPPTIRLHPNEVQGLQFRLTRMQISNAGMFHSYLAYGVEGVAHDGAPRTSA